MAAARILPAAGLAALLGGLLAGCGLKGPLYLPEKSGDVTIRPAPTPAGTPASGAAGPGATTPGNTAPATPGTGEPATGAEPAEPSTPDAGPPESNPPGTGGP